MNLQELKTKFPAVYKAAVEVGVKIEHDRATSHFVMGEQVGDVPLAIRSFRDGAELADVMPHYLQAARNRADILARLEDDDVVEAALANVDQATSTHVDPFEKQVTDRFVALLDTSAGGRNIEDLEDV